MALQLLTWWLVIQALGLVGLPLAAFVFRALPDRGYPFAKALGLLATGYGAWLLAMLGVGSFGGPLVVLVAIALGALGWYGMRGRGLPEFLRTNWQLLLGYEALFAAALIFVATLRATNLPGVISPDPWGTERPMDFAFFNTIQRSPQFPPLDPWLSGYSINYYYFGYLLMACVNLIARLPAAVAYNLSLALIFALTALGIAGLVRNMIAISANEERGTGSDKVAAPKPSFILHPSSFILPIAFALAAVLLLGNLHGAAQVFLGDEREVALNTSQFVTAASQAAGGAKTITLPAPLVAPDLSPAPITGWERKPADESFSWWWVSRGLWDNHDGARRYSITEFPAFSFMLGDMHPHVSALPFGLLALALALTTLARPAAPSYAAGRAGWAELLLTGLIIGSLYVINSWDLPTYVLLFVGALTLLYVRLAGGFAALPWRFLVRQVGLVGLASILLFVPFYITFRSFAGGEPATQTPVLRTISGIVGIVSWDKSELHAFLLIFATSLLPVVCFILAQRRVAPPAAPVLGIVAQGRSLASGVSGERLLDAGPWVVLGGLVLGWLVGFQLLFLLPLGVYAFGLALRDRERPAISFALLAAGLGCLIAFGTDIIYIRDGFGNRMNTIFKFYYQVWLIWGVIAAFGLWWLYTRRFSLRRPGGYLLGAALVALVAAGAVFPQHMAWRALAEGERTGLLGVTRRDNTPASAASIAWLRANAPDGSVVLEAVGNSYDVEGSGAAQVSAASGLPTVLGWPGHESQWRNGDAKLLDELQVRQYDIDAIYSATDANQARTLLEKYKVRYVYVGAYERTKYTPEGLAKFAALGTPAFQQDDVTIYQIP